MRAVRLRECLCLPDVVAAGVAGAGFDCGGWVPACLSGEPAGLGERVGQVGAEPGVLLLEGGYPVGLAAAEGPLPFSRGYRHGRRLPSVSNGRDRR
jgi:hypothetical protein